MADGPREREHGEHVEWSDVMRLLRSGLVHDIAQADSNGVPSLRVPDLMREVDSEAYTPRVVWLGLNNRTNSPERLHGDKLKVLCARLLFEAREKVAEAAHAEEDSWSRWETFVDALKIDLAGARGIYSLSSNHPSDDVVKNILAMDALFLVYSTFRTSPQKATCHRLGKLSSPDSLGVREIYWSYIIDRDILLLENQVPLYIVQRAVALLWPSDGKVLFDTLVKNFLVYHHNSALRRSDYLRDVRLLNDSNYSTQYWTTLFKLHLPGQSFHLLDYLRKVLCYGPPKPGSNPTTPAPLFKPAEQDFTAKPDTESTTPFSVPSARELLRAGIILIADSSYLHKLRFDETTSTLHIPRLEVSDKSLVLYRNLAACESILHYSDLYRCLFTFSAFLRFMGLLMHSKEDVSVLRSLGILKNKAGTDAELVDSWNKLCANMVTSDFTGRMEEMAAKINRRYESKVARVYRVYHEFRVHYFFATVLVLIMMVSQTLLLALSYTQFIQY